MAWIEGTEETAFVVNAPADDVAQFLADPEQIRHCLVGLESEREIEPGVYEWTLKEKSDKGIVFQPVYAVRYSRSGNKISWHTVGSGTMTSEGVATVNDENGKTTVQYRETIATDLPIPKLAAKIFRPIVAREIRKDVGKYLNNVQAYLEKHYGPA